MRKIKVYYQHDSMQCGIACLQMICKFYGRSYSVEQLSHHCFATTEGVSMLSLSEAATRLGMHTLCGRITTEQLKQATFPCILHWNQNHFIVLYRVKNSGKYYVADPGKGLLVYSEKEFKEGWISTCLNGAEKGIALFIQPTPAFYEQEEKETKEKRSFKFLFGYLKQYRRYFGQIILGTLVGCFIQLIFPFLTQSIVDIGIARQDLGFIYLILLGQLMLTFSRASADFIRRWLLLHISMRINISLVSDFFIKLLKLPMAFFDTKLTGDLLQRMNDHNRVEKFLTTQMLSVFFSTLNFIVFGCVLCAYSLKIGLIFLAGSIAYGGWIATFLKKRKVLDYQLFEKQAVNSSKTYQFITAMQEIKLQDCEQRRRWEWENVQADVFEVNMKILKLQQAQEAGSIIINEVKNIVITVIAATAVIKGDMTLGMMLAVQYIIGQLNAPVEQLMTLLYSLQDVRISLERINEIHSMNNEETGGKQLCAFTGKERELRFDRVDFKYDPHSSRKILDDISICIPEGKTTAIVGTSGSGKTTLLKLLLGYYAPLEGSIRIGNTDLHDFSLKWWRKQCGVVMQDGVIFSESIARNIAAADGEINTERLKQAARIACIDEYVEKLPLKYNTLIGQDGVGLSQGQKQRILIARAVYKNPSYIFLDEATNSLDANNERMIVENLTDFYRGRTVIVVAHRLSTVKNADQIIVIEKGKIIETGSHDELIKSQGAYFQLVRNQLELGN